MTLIFRLSFSKILTPFSILDRYHVLEERSNDGRQKTASCSETSVTTSNTARRQNQENHEPLPT
jgi:hypothetical protein